MMRSVLLIPKCLDPTWVRSFGLLKGSETLRIQHYPTTNQEDQRAAKELRQRAKLSTKQATAVTAEKESVLKGISPVTIDVGRQKYVLMEAHDYSAGESKLLVRGCCHSWYHREVAAKTASHLDGLGLTYEVHGGGRIHHRAKKTGDLWPFIWLPVEGRT